jgi:hypothetical protein
MNQNPYNQRRYSFTINKIILKFNFNFFNEFERLEERKHSFRLI